MSDNPNINLDRVGGTKQSAGNVIDPANNAVRVNLIAGSGGPVTIADGADVAQGSTGDAAWSSGAGTVIGLLKKIASAGGSAVSIADGSNVVEGTTTDAAIVSDSNGTLSGKLRGLVKMFADVWDSVNHRFNVALQNAIPAGANLIGKVSTDQTLHGTSDLVAADVTKVGGAALAFGQAASASSIPVVIASDQSPFALFARTLPLLNYASFTLADLNGVLWTTTMSDVGALVTALSVSAVAIPLYFNDIASKQTWQITVSTAGVLLKAPVAFNPQYQTAIGFITVGGLKSALMINGGVFFALQPTASPDFSVAIANGADVTEGSISDALVLADAVGSLSAKLRGMNFSLDQIRTDTRRVAYQQMAIQAALQQPDAGFVPQETPSFLGGF